MLNFIKWNKNVIFILYLKYLKYEKRIYFPFVL